MSNKSGTSEQVISLPTGSGALSGIGETFAPDLHTGTGNFTVPIALLLAVTSSSLNSTLSTAPIIEAGVPSHDPRLFARRPFLAKVLILWLLQIGGNKNGKSTS